MHVAAIIAAGGRGQRLGADRPKQLLLVGGRTILQRSVEA
ncbi:MAG: 2-C-methyl-D-erythritol 4-phosphate cytidylyltransferase, partial [Acidobacteria bacterium]|nr:2-C-methyl-D-erythritol 4-phosphate cytidylyltransferase [Acidobacteriota bacterium]